MRKETEQPLSFEEAAAFIRNFPRQTRRRDRDFSGLHPHTYDYLCADKQKLGAERDQAAQANDTTLARQASRRLEYYYLVEDFFLYLAEQGDSTALDDISTVLIDSFLHRQRPTTQYKPLKQALIPGLTDQRAQNREKAELKTFFERAVQAQLIGTNPMIEFDKTLQKLRPDQLSFRTMADCLAFESFLQERVERNLLSPHTAKLHYRNFMILLHDVERQHAADPDWPMELDDLFADPKWLATWLKQLKNRSNVTKSQEMARSTLKLYLNTLRYLWLFLKLRGRAANPFYDELKALFLVDERVLLLPGRRARIIKALSEAEEKAVLDCIEHYSSTPILMRRDRAMFVTALETAIRVDGLNQMRIENMKETEPGVFVCYSRVKRSARRSGHSSAQLAGDQMEWRDWFMSPRAIEVIGEYLQATGRDWTGQGPIWLTHEGQPLSLSTQKGVIREWLKMAGCKITRPHVLRHTAVERMINKYQLPIPIVQQISQHANTKILLDVYAQGATEDAFRRVNQVLPGATPHDLNSQEVVLAVGAALNGLSAQISRRQLEKRTFTRQHLLELVAALSRETDRLGRLLGCAPATQVIPLSPEDYQRLGETLGDFGLSYQKILGHDPGQPEPKKTGSTERIKQ